MKQIIMNLNSTDNYLYYTNEIRQGENLANELVIKLSPEWTGYKYLIRFKLNNNNEVVTPELFATNGEIKYGINTVLTSEAGNLKVQFEAFETVESTTRVIKSAITNLRVTESLEGGTTIVPEDYAPWYTQAVNAASTATTKAQEAATSAANAQTTVDNHNTSGTSHADIRQQINNLDAEKADNTRVDAIITTPVGSVSAEEIIDARVGEVSLGAKIRKVDLQLADTTKKRTPQIITLIGGQDDEVPKPALSLNTVESDLVNFKLGDRGWKVNVLGASGHQVDFEPDVGYWTFPPICTIGAWVYIEDATKLTSIAFNFYNNEAKTIISSYPSNANSGTLKNGWNLIRWSVDYPNTKLEYSSIYRIRVIGASTSATSYTIGHLWAECSEKAQILFIHDGGYKNFYNVGYPDLKARNIPVTWGLIPNKIDTNDSVFITQAQADKLSEENNNSMSFHSWNLEVTDTMTASQLRAETMKSLKWLKRKGYKGGIFRCAFTQNLAQNHTAIRNLVLAYRRVSNGTTNILTCYPFPNRYDIDTIRLHSYNSNLSGLTAQFNSLKKYRTIMVCYTHKINEAGGTDMTPELWNLFLSEIDKGISEGWLEGVTFESLFAKSGGSIKRGFGDTVVELYDEEGKSKTLRIP